MRFPPCKVIAGSRPFATTLFTARRIESLLRARVGQALLEGLERRVAPLQVHHGVEQDVSCS